MSETTEAIKTMASRARAKVLVEAEAELIAGGDALLAKWCAAARSSGLPADAIEANIKAYADLVADGRAKSLARLTSIIDQRLSEIDQRLSEFLGSDAEGFAAARS